MRFFEQFTSYLVIWNHFDCDSSIWALNPSTIDLWLSYKTWYFYVKAFTSSNSFLLIFSISLIFYVEALESSVMGPLEGPVSDLDAYFHLFSYSER